MARMMPCVGKETYTDMAEDDDNKAPGQASAEKQGGSPAATVQDRQISSLRKSVTILAALLLVLLVAIIGLLIGVIILGVRSDKDNNSSSTLSSSAAASAPPGTTLLSSSMEAPAGYKTQGTLFSGSGSWLQKAALGAGGGSDLAGAAVGTAVYLIGGYDAGNVNVTDRVSLYYSELDTFSPSIALPVASARGGAATIGTTVYYIGGRTSDDSLLAAGSCAFSLDTAAVNGTWVALPCPTTIRSDHCVAEAGGKVYIIGGYSADYSQAMDTVEEYDPATGAWRTLPLQLPTGRGDVACASLDGRLHIAGGFASVQSGSTTATNFDAPIDTWFTTDHLVVDPVAGTVAALAPMLHTRGDATMVALPGGKLLLMGGQTQQGDSTTVATYTVTMYVTSADVWVEKAPMADARFRFVAAPVPHHSSAISVMAFGGHHRCDNVGAGESGCDQARSAESFMDVSDPVIFLHVPDDASALGAAIDSDVQITSTPGGAGAGWIYQSSLHRGSGQWVSMPNLAAGRTDFHAMSVGDLIYLVGGLDAAGAPVASVDTFDPVIQTYPSSTPMTLAAAPLARFRYASAVLDSKIYIAGGINAAEGPPTSGSQQSTMLVYDTATSAWSSVASMKQARSDACAATVDGKIYVTGGYDNTYATLSSTEIYDPVADSWSDGPALPEPRGDCVAASLNGTRFVVVGGYHDPSGGFSPTAFHDSVFSLSVGAKQWMPLASLPDARGDQQLVALPGNRLLVMGGETGTSAGDGRTQIGTHEVHEYLGDQDVWVSKAMLPVPRFRFGAAAYSGMVYVFGGHQICDGDTCSDDTHDSADAYFDVMMGPSFISIRQ